MYICPTINGILVNDIKKLKVSKIKGKYFYLDNYREKYSLKTLKHESVYHLDILAHFSEQDILDGMQMDRINARFKMYCEIKNINPSTLTLEERAEINEVIKGIQFIEGKINKIT